MKSSSALMFALAVGGGVLASEREASALGPLDVEVGAKIGGGTAPFSNQPNALGFGLGARAGVVVLGGWYGGASIVHYFGGTGTVGLGDVATSGAGESSTLFGIEGGYGVNLLGLLTVRGQLGVGSFNLGFTGIELPGVSNLYLEPGLTVLASFGLLFVGADVNLLVLPGIVDPLNPKGPSTWATTLTSHAQVGVKF
jgi:hypothetical protein